MLSFLRNFEPFSFWLGFIVASLLWWILRKAAPVLHEFLGNISNQVKSVRESAKAGVEYHYLNDILSLTQTMHLASPLFSLDEILIPPRIMATPPTPSVDTEGESKRLTDITMQAIPYMPDWPELSAAFNSPTYSLSDALAKGTNLTLIGYAGSGKTVALAHLASQLAKGDPIIGELANRLPILVHYGDIPSAELEANQTVQTIYATLVHKISSRTNSKFDAFLEKSFAEGRVLLMVDGMDELDQEGFDRATGFIESVLNQFPGTQIVATASPFYYDGLARLGLVPVAMAAWNETQQETFIRKWGAQWIQHIQREPWSTSSNGKREVSLQIQPEILNNWLTIDSTVNSPFEITLKTWAAYAGDTRGPSNANAIEAYIRRMATGSNEAGTALERIAFQIALKRIPFPTQRSANRWSRAINLDDLEDSAQTGEVIEPAEDSDVITGEVSRQAVSMLLTSGILVNRADSRLGFIHPSIGGYCAGKALASTGGSSWVQDQPDWTGKQQALQFLAYFGIPGGATIYSVDTNEDIIHQQLFFTARWLPESLTHPKASWRISLMRDLFNLVGSHSTSLGVRSRAMAALLRSRDPGIPQMCRRLIQHEAPDVRRVAALGLGVLKDDKSINELSELLYESFTGVHQAASLALVSIGTQQALEAVATAMLHGEENHQRSCAEALANHVDEGYPILKEASAFDDLMARRAAVYGLARIQEPWARELIEEVRAHDNEWIVRNAAEEIANLLEQGSPFVPGPHKPLHEAGWLLVFAAKRGEGVPPGIGAEETYQRALVGGEDVERMAAMYHLKYLSENAGESAIPILYSIFLQERDELQEAAYLALWFLSVSGHSLPSPIKFGIGTQNW